MWSYGLHMWVRNVEDKKIVGVDHTFYPSPSTMGVMGVDLMNMVSFKKNVWETP